ncbi:MAG: hypothetical protein Q4D58_11205 [Synergistaceae bacterium]|nr:hypothetical protein [Synergistaceae bacterium]
MKSCFIPAITALSATFIAFARSLFMLNSILRVEPKKTFAIFSQIVRPDKKQKNNLSDIASFFREALDEDEDPL